MTIAAQSGATPQISISFGSSVKNIRLDGLRISGGNLNGAHDVAIVNSTFTGYFEIDTPSGQNLGVLLDHNTHDGVGQGTYEGRVSIRGANNNHQSA